MKRTLIAFLSLAVLGMSLVGCANYKDIVYLQDINTYDVERIYKQYEPKIKVDDRLTIVVSGPDKMVTAPYNLTLADITKGGAGTTNPENSTLSYLVDMEGCISFPILGRIHVEGMTRRELTEYLTLEIGKDVKDPIVYITFKNFRVTVIGEVRAPGTYTLESEKMTIFQAIGKAGDLNLTAERQGVIVLRDEDGEHKHYELDLRSASVFESPAYFVQQNDVIIVQPSPTRVSNATLATGVWSLVASSVSTLSTITTLVFMILRK